MQLYRVCLSVCLLSVRARVRSASNKLRFVYDYLLIKISSLPNGGTYLRILRYTVDHKMVRGLDYYTGTVFEFVTDALGAQGAVLAGGRYDELVCTLSPKHSAPAVGWAAGVERLELLMDALEVPPVSEPTQFWVVEAHPKATETSATVSQTSLWLAQQLRAVGHTVRHDHGTVLKKQLKVASQHGADVVFIVGEDELESRSVSVKNMATGEQVAMPLDTDWAQFL